MGEQFGQHIAPAVRYMQEDSYGAKGLPDSWVFGDVTFQRPLYVPFGGMYREADNWKRVLANSYGETGEALSRAIVADGFDGIVTYLEDGSTSEIVDLTSFVELREFREDKRGSITFDDELRNVVIRMTEASDLSTFLHESGHLYLAQLAKDAAEAGGQLEADLAVVREAFGDDVTSTEVQEAWARAFEAYLFEGSAPTLRLRAAFQRFSAWLVRIYKRLRGIPGFQGPLTPEIRGVMDRLIATDEEIEQTRTDLGLDEMDATALGLSEAEAARYRETVERARSEAASEMQAKLMAELARQKTEEWKELREKAHAEVEADVNQRPVFRAKHWLQRGEALEGAPVPILKHARLDRDALRQLYGPDILKVLPKGKYGLWQVNGLHPDTVAEVFGFESGDALVRALSAAGNRLDVIQAETDKLMESRHGKFQTQDEVAQLAIEALSNETQVKALLIEERALAKRAGGRVTPEQVARNAAKRIVGQTKYRDLAPHRYRQAAKRASRDAIEHAAEGRFAEAQASKRRQLVSMFMESEARKAIDQVDRAARYLHDVQKPKSRQRIGKAGGDHLNQMGQLLDRYDLRRGISLREIDRTKGLAAWIKEQEDAGAEVRVPQYLIDRTEKIAWKELTVDELLGLRDAVKNIEHLARMKNEFLANKRRRERDAVRADLVESIRKNATQRELPKELNLSKEEARARSLLSLDTQLVKIEFLADFLDGNDPNGHWKANVVEPIRDVARTRIEKSEQFTEALAGLYQRFLKPNLREYGKRVYLNELGVTGTKLEILMLALNMGAAENVQRIADGNGYSEAQVMALLDRTMTEGDWQFVREVWALTGELGKWLFEVEARMTGLEPTKVEGRTIQTRFGEIEGAYFPIVYDPDGS
ncbi:MAG: hypothetical protein KDC14_18430, partial [Planctomycetes bacterium]|nr:hypothetical protein [Planctomycetota bacterium]